MNEEVYQSNIDAILRLFSDEKYTEAIEALSNLDNKYPNRLQIVIGESQDTVPLFSERHPHVKFDLIFIDGAHWEPIPKLDLENCRKLAHENTIILFDDTCYSKELKRYWNEYPTKVWTEAIEKNEIVELGRKDFDSGRGMSWGKYVFDSEII